MPSPKLAITIPQLGDLTELEFRCANSLSDYSWFTHYDPTQLDWLRRMNTSEDNLGVTGSLQWLYENTTAPIIAFLHSDAEVFEQGWDERVLKEFDDPRVGVVGFGGALQLGEDDIYKKPYALHQLRRIHYMSNQTDAEVHGERFTGECDVATLDGFALIVRRELLDKWEHSAGDGHYWNKPGWPYNRYPYHNYDNALCLEAHKQGYRVRLVGCKVHHHGGATSTTAAGQQYWHSLGTTDQTIHTQSHLNLYQDGRGWLPLRAKV